MKSVEPTRAGREEPRKHLMCINKERKDRRRRVSVVCTDVVLAASAREIFVLRWPKTLVWGVTRRGILCRSTETCDTKAGAWWARCTHGH